MAFFAPLNVTTGARKPIGSQALVDTTISGTTLAVASTQAGTDTTGPDMAGSKHC